MLFSFVSATLQLSVAAAVNAPKLPVRSGAITARIESDKTAYRLGEPIRLRLWLMNTTGSEIDYIAAAPYEISDLHVLKDGHQLSPSEGRGPCFCQGRVYAIPLQPGKSVLVEYNDKRNSGALSEWAYIRDWGYELSDPGYYSLSVSPTVNAIGMTGPEFRTSAAGRSNVLHITITK